MGKRRLARELTLQFLYQTDALKGFNPENNIKQNLELFWSVKSNVDDMEIKNFMEVLSQGVVENVQGIDDIISKYSTHWKLPRMPSIDRNILRMAIYEIVYLSDIPAPVTINEAIEIAKKFGSDESGGFINGILDRVSNAMDRGELGL